MGEAVAITCKTCSACPLVPILVAWFHVGENLANSLGKTRRDWFAVREIDIVEIHFRKGPRI